MTKLDYFIASKPEMQDLDTKEVFALLRKEWKEAEFMIAHEAISDNAITRKEMQYKEVKYEIEEIWLEEYEMLNERISSLEKEHGYEAVSTNVIRPYMDTHGYLCGNTPYFKGLQVEELHDLLDKHFCSTPLAGVNLEREMPFSERLSALRKAKGLTQAKLSEITKIPKRTIEDWEAGKRVPTKYMQDSVLERITERKSKEMATIISMYANEVVRAAIITEERTDPVRSLIIDSIKQKYPAEDFKNYSFKIYKTEFGPNFGGPEDGIIRDSRWDYEIYKDGALISAEGEIVAGQREIRYYVKKKVLKLIEEDSHVENN